MDLTLSGLITLISLIAGILSIIFAIINFCSAYSIRKEKINQAKETLFKSAIESNDLEKLGTFLEKNIGNFTIHEYVTDNDVNLKVNSYFERLQSFLSTQEEFEKESSIQDQLPHQIEGYPVMDTDFEKILNELNFGDTWNSLARLRRTIEIRIKDYAKANDIQFKENISAGQILNILRNQNKISNSIFENLKYSVSISNDAIHGKEVSYEKAQEAIYHAKNAIDELNHIISN